MKKEFKEYKGFWYVENEEDWNISRQEDDNGDAWYFSKASFSLDEAINKILQMDYFDSICRNVVDVYGVSGFIEFINHATYIQYSLKRDNKK